MTTRSDQQKITTLRSEARRVRSPARKVTERTSLPAATVASFCAAVVKIAVVIVLPFVACVRAAVFFYLRGAGTWLAILAGAGLALGIVAAYAAALARRFTGRARLGAATKWVAAPFVAAWCGYALLYMASANAKSTVVRESYRSVHPVLRMALATIILVDEEVVVTDMARAPSDYVRMGLPIFNRTMHYRQADGWVHAVDLRTNGHNEVKNRAVQLYFWMMGFDTLRHVGTADHLHVQLPLRPR